MPKLPAKKVPTARLSGLSLPVLEDLQQAMGGITKDFSIIEAFGQRFSPESLLANRVSEDEILAIIGTRVDVVVQLPEEAKWQYVACRLIDGHTLSVSYNRKYIDKYGHDQLGFAMRNTRDGKPDKSWELLQFFALLFSYENGRLTKPTASELAGVLHIKVATLYKRIEALSLKLQHAFGINESPFEEYNPALGYQLRFRLKPEALLRGQGALRPSGSIAFENILEDEGDEDSEE